MAGQEAEAGLAKAEVEVRRLRSSASSNADSAQTALREATARAQAAETSIQDKEEEVKQAFTLHAVSA